MYEERRPGYKQWDEFIRSLDAAVLLAFLVEDAELRTPDSFLRLAHRIRETFSDVSVERDDSRRFEPDPDIFLLELADQVEEAGAPEEFWYVARSLAATAIHSALDVYVRDVTSQHAGPLPERLDNFIRGRCSKALDRKLFNALLEYDATRHVLVHNRGVIDEKYISRVPDNPFVPGESRPLSSDDVLRYAHLALNAGHALHECVVSGAA